MILYHFPPIGGISMSRNARIVQRLPGHGWDPVVITPRSSVSEPRDATSMALVPADADIERTRYFELHQLKPIVEAVRRLLAALGRQPSVAVPDGAARSLAEDPQSPADPVTVATRRIAWVRRRLMFPDNQAGWLPFALVRAIRVSRREPAELIFSTSPPVTAHIVGGLVARLTKTPWVAEFRDPWLGNALELPHPWIERRLRTRVERWVIRATDRVICVTPALTSLYRRRYPDAIIETITNGYERTELEAAAATRTARDRFTLVYTGTLDRPAELETFLEGVALLVDRRPAVRDSLAIIFYGTVSRSAVGPSRTGSRRGPWPASSSSAGSCRAPRHWPHWLEPTPHSFSLGRVPAWTCSCRESCTTTSVAITRSSPSFRQGMRVRCSPDWTGASSRIPTRSRSNWPWPDFWRRPRPSVMPILTVSTTVQT